MRDWKVRVLLQSIVLFVVFSCPALVVSAEPGKGEILVLAVNDVYRIEGVGDGQEGGLARVRALRQELEKENSDVLFLHAGDFLFPSLLSEWTQGAHMIELMNRLDGAPGVFDPRMVVAFGNHEFDRSDRSGAATLEARINQSEFQWLGSNIRFSQEEGKRVVALPQLKDSIIYNSGGVRVGIYGLTTDRNPASRIAYVEEFLDPVLVAQEQTKRLRAQGAEVVIALTHLALDKDRDIVETLGERGPDLIIGGHEHQRHHVEINGRWILKADADARTATVVRIRMREKKPLVSFGYRFLDRDHMKPDTDTQRHVDQALKEHEAWFCLKDREKADCLRRTVGETVVPLQGEEQEIRRYETNLGNWVADQMLAAAPDADIAFINAGALRVNQTIAPGPITRRHIEELLFYDSALVRAELTHQELEAVLERATEDWVGQGHWLQVSGMAFQHDPRNPQGHRVGEIRLFQNGQLRPLPNRSLRVVTNTYLMDGGDGYALLSSLKTVPAVPSLKKRIVEILRSQPHPILPMVDGRICNVAELEHRPCAFNQDSHPMFSAEN